MTDASAMADGDAQRFEVVMGFELEEWREGFCRFRVVLGPRHMNRNGVPHGGVVSALIDAAGMYAGNANAAGERLKAVTVSMSCNFIGAAKGDVLICEGRLLRAGRGTFFAEARLTDGLDGPLLATGQGAYKYLR